jgi:hypothetical protein
VFAVNPETDADSPGTSLVVTPVNGENEPVVFRNISTVDNDPPYRLTSAELVYVPPNVEIFGK